MAVTGRHLKCPTVISDSFNPYKKKKKNVFDVATTLLLGSGCCRIGDLEQIFRLKYRM